jgi:hypothetical protein
MVVGTTSSTISSPIKKWWTKEGRSAYVVCDIEVRMPIEENTTWLQRHPEGFPEFVDETNIASSLSIRNDRHKAQHEPFSEDSIVFVVYLLHDRNGSKSLCYIQ